MILRWPDFEAERSCACSVPLRNTPGSVREGIFPRPPPCPLVPRQDRTSGVPHDAPALFSPTTTCAAEGTGSCSLGPGAMAGESPRSPAAKLPPDRCGKEGDDRDPPAERPARSSCLPTARTRYPRMLPPLCPGPRSPSAGPGDAADRKSVV